MSPTGTTASTAEDLDDLAAAVDAFCADRLATPTHLRPGSLRDRDRAREQWSEAGAAVGLAGLIVPEVDGGSGASLIEAARVAEVLAARLAVLPYLSSGVLGPQLLTAADTPQAHALLRELATGERLVAVAFGGTDLSRPRPDRCPPASADDEVEGTFSYVVDADLADVVLCVDDGGSRVVAVPADDLTVTTPAPFDLLRPVSTVRASGIRGTVIATGQRARTAVGEMLAAGRLAVAAESAGGARAALSEAVSYAGQRLQFGRPVGSFQAIKHLLADAYVTAESALSVARAAVDAYALERRDAGELLALASFSCPESCAGVTATAIQVHGGLGFTAECAAHLRRRRAEADRQLFGEPAVHRAEYLAQLTEREVSA